MKIKLMHTPFHHFMDAGSLVVDSMFLDDICGRYRGSSQFVFGNTVLTCTDEDFGKILGLPHTGRKIDLLNATSKLNSSRYRFFRQHLHGKLLTRYYIINGYSCYYNILTSSLLFLILFRQAEHRVNVP